MLISLKSNNPQLSYLLSKNPNSLPLGRKVRKGHALGWFNGEDNYVVSFFECLRTTGSVSFSRNPKDDFAYLYDGEYCDLYCAVSLLNEYFRTLINEDENEYDGDFENSITVHSIKWPKIWNKILKFFDVQYEIVDQCDKWEDYKVIKFFNKGRMVDLLQNMVILFIFGSFDGDGSIRIEDELVARYVKIINKLGLPYYPRSLFKLKIGHCIHKFIDDLNTDTIKMTKFDTHMSRIEFAKEQTGKDKIVLDFGVGEFRHGRKIAPKSKKYIGIDKDPEVLEEARFRANRNDCHNVEFYSSIDECPKQEIDVLICSEVIEHMESPEIAVDELVRVINKFEPKKVIITTPNKEFNVNYLFEDGQMRHDDHKFELDSAQFNSLLEWISQGSYSVHQVGDVVDGKSCTFGGVITWGLKDE